MGRNMKTRKPLKAFAVRADEEKLRAAIASGVDTGELFRAALDQELMKRKGKCPTCGRKVENKDG